MNIDQEFKSLIPQLTDDEYKQLEKNIIKDGCRDSLVVWEDTLIDGHNRYKICTKNNIPFKTENKILNNRTEAIEWIIRNQFGRRNLPMYERGRLALRLESVIKEKAKGNLGGDRKGEKFKKSIKHNCAESINPISTRDELAKVAGVSHATIDRIKLIEREATPKQKEELAKGTKKIYTVYKELRPPKTKESKYKEPRATRTIDDEITNKVCEELLIDKSEVVMTTDDLIMDLECFSSSFTRNLNRCTNDYKIKATQSDNEKLTNILLETEKIINKFRGVFIYE